MSESVAGPVRVRKHPLMWIAFLAMLTLYAWAYCYLGTILILEKNTVHTAQPQASFVDAVYRSASIGEDAERPSVMRDFTRAFPQYTDGIVDPLFPWLMRGRSSEPPDVVFEAGKWTNLILSGSLLVIFAVAAARAFSFAGALAVIVSGGFGIILEFSGYFSSDALYLLLVVVTWLCALSLIRQNHLWLYAVFGVLLGITYLAKPLVWPIALGFLIVSVIRSIWLAIRARRDRSEAGLWVSSNQLVGFAMTIAAFLIITGPRLTYSGERFGDPFHSYLKYSVWLDSPAEAVAFRQEHPGARELKALPFLDKPGPVAFVRQQGMAALLDRGWRGALAQVGNSVLGRAGSILLYAALVFVTVAAIHRWAAAHQSKEVWLVRGTSARWMLLFLATVVAITLFYTGIGNPAVPHNAMTTSLFLPILVTFIWIAERYRRQLQRSRLATLVNRVYVSMMAVGILWITWRIFVSLGAPVTGA